MSIWLTCISRSFPRQPKRNPLLRQDMNTWCTCINLRLRRRVVVMVTMLASSARMFRNACIATSARLSSLPSKISHGSLRYLAVKRLLHRRSLRHLAKEPRIWKWVYASNLLVAGGGMRPGRRSLTAMPLHWQESSSRSKQPLQPGLRAGIRRRSPVSGRSSRWPMPLLRDFVTRWPCYRACYSHSP